MLKSGNESVENGIPEITPQELKQRLDAGEDLLVLDVREPSEYHICNLGGHLIPLGDLPLRLRELDSDREIVTHCKAGVRGAKAVEYLLRCGFRNVKNLSGGILAWAEQVDPTMPRY